MRSRVRATERLLTAIPAGVPTDELSHPDGQLTVCAALIARWEARWDLEPDMPQPPRLCKKGGLQWGPR